MALVRTSGGAVTPVAAPPPPGRSTGVVGRWRQRRRDQEQINRLADIWHDLAIGLDLDQHRLGTLGTTVRVPVAVGITPGDEPRIMVRLLPGQTAGDLAQYAGRIAQEFGYAHARITARANKWAAIDLLSRDPLAASVLLSDRGGQPGLSVADLRLLLGMDGGGRMLTGTLPELRHIIVQGQTGGGKSSFVYGLLMQLVDQDDVLIAGSDISGVLLRPFAGTVHAPWQALGADVDRHLDVLRELESELDGRLAGIPPRVDHVTPDDGCPLVLVVVEEYAGLLRRAAGSKNGKAVVEEIRRIVARITSEGRKVAIYALLILNRADTTVLPGFERGQANTRISFRVDSADAVQMLHAGGRDMAEEHATAPDGVALLSRVRQPLVRVKAAHVTYDQYWRVIESRAACLPGDVP